jgi:DNA primase
MRLSEEQRKLLEQTTKHYEQDISLAEGYLASRGLSLLDARRHRLGVVKRPIVGHEQYEGRLSIPYITPAGVVDIRFRTINHEEPKYLGLPGAETRLYNVGAYFEATDHIAICEGEIDTITLSSINIPAIGIPGVKGIKRHYYKIFSDFPTVYVFADGDQPGRDFAKDLAKKLSGVVIITMPDGEDVNSMFIKHGEEWFTDKLEERLVA